MEGWAFSFLLSLNSDFQDLKVCRGASGWRRCGEGVCFGSGFFERFEIMLLGVGGKKSEPIYIVFQGKCTYCSQGENWDLWVGDRVNQFWKHIKKKKNLHRS